MPPQMTAVKFQAPSTTVRALITITVLYDNSVISPSTRADWGFSCLIQGFDKTILFDTGSCGNILLRNMEILGIKPEMIDVVVLSHDHSDHTGGLAQVIVRYADVVVYYPNAFSQDSILPAREAGKSLVPAHVAVFPCLGMTVTAPLGKSQESGLLLETVAGKVLITGCARPGVVEMVATVVEHAHSPVMALLGGFHLMSYSAKRARRVAENFGRWV